MFYYSKLLFITDLSNLFLKGFKTIPKDKSNLLRWYSVTLNNENFIPENFRTENFIPENFRTENFIPKYFKTGKL